MPDFFVLTLFAGNLFALSLLVLTLGATIAVLMFSKEARILGLLLTVPLLCFMLASWLGCTIASPQPWCTPQETLHYTFTPRF